MSRQYLNAGRAVNAVLAGTSLKNYCGRNKIGKLEYALVCETLKYMKVIRILLQNCEINIVSLDVNEGMFFVYCYELLFGSKKIQGGGAIKRILMEQAPILRQKLSEWMTVQGASEHSELLDHQFEESSRMPVYIRINTIKARKSINIDFVRSIYSGAKNDIHIPNLIELPSTTKGVWEHDCCKSGEFIIQDKASCIPSQVLFDAWKGGDIVDACAAPGNKTSHLSALVMSATKGDGVSIFAFDKSPARWNLLKSRMNAAGAVNVVTANEDFLNVNVLDPRFSNVTSVLVDPSCSGSGVVRSIDRVYERVNSDVSSNYQRFEQDRILLLQSFQIKSILKAMTFPLVSLVVYSTCSVNEEENEYVVAKILRETKLWRLASPDRFMSWSRRGHISHGLTEEEANCLIRCSPADRVNGFFVALFEKISGVADASSEITTAATSVQHGLSVDGDDLKHNIEIRRAKRISKIKRKPSSILWQHFSKRLKY